MAFIINNSIYHLHRYLINRKDNNINRVITLTIVDSIKLDDEISIIIDDRQTLDEQNYQIEEMFSIRSNMNYEYVEYMCQIIFYVNDDTLARYDNLYPNSVVKEPFKWKYLLW